MAGLVNSPMGVAIPEATKAVGKYLALNKIADEAGEFSETLGKAASLADVANDVRELVTLGAKHGKDIFGRLNIAKLPYRYAAPVVAADLVASAMSYAGERDTKNTEKEMQGFKNMTREELLNYRNPAKEATLDFFDKNVVGRGLSNLGYWLRKNNLDGYF